MYAAKSNSFGIDFRTLDGLVAGKLAYLGQFKGWDTTLVPGTQQVTVFDANFPLSHAFGGGEGRVRGRHNETSRSCTCGSHPLTPALSPTFVGERGKCKVSLLITLQVKQRCQVAVVDAQAGLLLHLGLGVQRYTHARRQ